MEYKKNNEFIEILIKLTGPLKKISTIAILAYLLYLSIFGVYEFALLINDVNYIQGIRGLQLIALLLVICSLMLYVVFKVVINNLKYTDYFGIFLYLSMTGLAILGSFNNAISAISGYILLQILLILVHHHFVNDAKQAINCIDNQQED